MTERTLIHINRLGAGIFFGGVLFGILGQGAGFVGLPLIAVAVGIVTVFTTGFLVDRIRARHLAETTIQCPVCNGSGRIPR